MWITLTEDDVLTRLAGAELNAAKTAAKAVGQVNPLPDVLNQVTQEVRARVAACSQNRLGEGSTIPEELKAAALDLARYRLCTRLPVPSLITPQREAEYKDALALLRDVAACSFRIEQPATISDQVIAGPAVQLVTANRRKATRCDLEGL
jgi:phage gp36-like protein